MEYSFWASWFVFLFFFHEWALEVRVYNTNRFVLFYFRTLWQPSRIWWCKAHWHILPRRPAVCNVWNQIPSGNGRHGSQGRNMEHVFCNWEGTGDVGKGDRWDGCAAVQVNLDRLQKRADRNLVKLSHGNTSPAPGRNGSINRVGCAVTGWKAGSLKRTSGSW